MRLRQGLESLTEGHDGESVDMMLSDKKNIPRLYKWVMADIEKEEGDVMREMGLTQKEVREEVMGRVRECFGKKA